MLGVDDYEADDVMATFAVKEKGPIRVVTGDRDLFQLVDDKRDVKVVYLARGISQHDLVDIKWVAEKYGIPGERYALFAMFRGDPSDGLPGVKGIGEKGAALIANNFATVEEALNGAKAGHESLTPNLAKKIIEGADYLKIAPTLVHCKPVMLSTLNDRWHLVNDLVDTLCLAMSTQLDTLCLLLPI